MFFSGELKYKLSQIQDRAAGYIHLFFGYFNKKRKQNQCRYQVESLAKVSEKSKKKSRKINK